MFIAQIKKKENIAEYLLYLWQIEDLIRAYDLNLETIRVEVVDHFDCSADDKRQMLEWYESLIDMMRREGRQKNGHIQLIGNVILDLNDLHLRLMASTRYPHYASSYYSTLPYAVELRAKNGNQEMNELEHYFAALYGFMMLRLQKKEVSIETTQAIRNISAYLSLLASYYKKDKAGELELE